MTLLPNFGGFHRTLQRVRLANRGRLLLRTPGPVPFGTCICSNVETILSWTCHVYGPFEFRTFLGTSILLRYCNISGRGTSQLRYIFVMFCNIWGLRGGLRGLQNPPLLVGNFIIKCSFGYFRAAIPPSKLSRSAF